MRGTVRLCHQAGPGVAGCIDDGVVVEDRKAGPFSATLRIVPRCMGPCQEQKANTWSRGDRAPRPVTSDADHIRARRARSAAGRARAGAASPSRRRRPRRRGPASGPGA